ncbi:MAG TPA: pyrroline-5-carboxylate reductase, partial [Casimicrobiaceae bacterium]|nr:pyrroline-5-carboxylate reductase [Casimicrobiaceae bacterium]
MQSIVFLGGGNMATALAGGMIAAGTPPQRFVVVEPAPGQRATLAAKFPGVRVVDAPTADALRDAGLVVLAVKPQHMREACASLAPLVRDVPAVLSIAAGTRIADVSRWLGGYDRIVRAMPNTPALVGAGISGLYASATVPAAAREAAEALLGAAGEVLRVEREATLDPVTGVSASGAAYVFYFLEGLEEAAQAMGFAPSDARRLALATLDGAVKLAQASDTP